MALFSKLSTIAAFAATIPLVLPGVMQSASAKETHRSRLTSKSQATEPRPVNLVLQPDNILVGEVITADGKPLRDTEVVIHLGRHEVARVATNQFGEFSAEVPRGGVYVVTSSVGTLLVRAWTAHGAPPNSLDKVSLMPQTTVIRAQDSGGGFNPLLGVLLAGGIAAAIAIPIALNNNGDDDSSSNNSRTNPGDNGNDIPQSP